MPHAIHHSLTLSNQREIQIRDRHSLTLRNRRTEDISFRANNRRKTTAAQSFLQFVISGNLTHLFGRKPACGIDHKTACFQRMMTDRHFHLICKNLPHHRARKLRAMDLLVLYHQRESSQGVVMLPAG